MTFRRLLPSLTILSLAALSLAQQTSDQAGTHPAQPKPKSDFGHWIGIDAGLYYPTNSVIRDVYGTGVKLGISPVTHIRNDNWHLDGDLSLISDDHNGNKLFILPVNAAFERAFGPEDGASQPFIRISAGAVYNDHTFDVPTNEVPGIAHPGLPPATSHFSNKTVGADAAIEVGTVLSRKLRLSARYNLFSKSDGFDFSGFTFSVQYSAFRY